MKTGFVYIWFDRKRKMYYIGSHMGNINDGYICSSNRMRDAYRKRKEDFSRKILFSGLFENRLQLLNVEEKWLKLASKKKNKYYNVSFSVNRPWWSIESGIERFKKSKSWYFHSIETKVKISNANKNTQWITRNGENKKIKLEMIDEFLNDGWTKGRTFDNNQSEEVVEKRRQSSIGKKRSDQSRLNISNGRKGIVFSEKHKKNLSEREFTDEWKVRISESLVGRNLTDEVRSKISNTMKGRKMTDEHRRKLSEAAKRRKRKI